MNKSAVLVVSTALVFSSMASAKEKAPASLAKTSKWEINYDKDSCHLTAKFGEDKKSAIVRITRYEPSSKFDLTVYGEPFSVRDSRTTAKVWFGIEKPVQVDAMSGTSSNKMPLLIFNSVRIDGWQFKEPRQIAPIVSIEQETQASFIEFAIAGRKPLRLETGSLAAPMNAMRVCTADLLKHWGYDPAQQMTLSRPATPLKPPGSWLRDGDFPQGAMGSNGLVQFRLDIDAAGKVAGCSILHRTNPDEFADLTCKLIGKRAQFVPALDKDGNPIRSYFVSKVRWLTGEG